MAIFKSNIKNTLKDEFIQSIKRNFNRKTITSCSRWASQYRMIKSKPWNFKRFPWLIDMHDSDAVMNVGQKAAQLGYTETMLNVAFYNIDIHNRDILYVLPSSKPSASDFSASRFDPAVEDSKHLSNLFSDVKNVGHKRAGSANLYIRGAKSRDQLKSIPTAVVILDEADEMPRENIPLAFERTSGQDEKQIWLISTPSLEDYGISTYYKQSTQNEFYFKCPSCTRYINLQFPRSIKIMGESIDDPRIKDTHLICNLCEAVLPHENKVDFLQNYRWVETYSNRDTKGWHISQLYSTTIHPSEIAKSYFMALSDSSFEQELYNSKLGLTHEVEGARITDSQIKEVIGSYTQILNNDYNDKPVTMGVDVGYPFIHYEIDEWKLPQYATGSDLNFMSKPRILKCGKVRDLEELDQLMIDFRVRYCVIDAHPERRKAYEFATRFWGHVRLAFYGNGITGKQIHISDMEEPTLTVDRTSWLDLSLGRFRNQSITIPADTPLEYKEHIKAPIRIYKKDKTGNPVGSYVNSKADHFAHARNYAEMALPLAVSLSESRSIPSVL